MPSPEGYKNKFLPKPPKRLAVIDQDACTGCAGAPTCVTFCETVTAGEGDYVGAIPPVGFPPKPLSNFVGGEDKCNRGALCAPGFPWDALTKYYLNHPRG